MTKRISRRGALRAIGGSAATALLVMGGDWPEQPAAAATDTLSDPDSALASVGTVRTVTPDALGVMTGDGLVTVVREGGTRIYAGAAGRVADFRAFLIGDRVVIAGTSRTDGAIAARSVGSVLRPVQATVLAFDPATGVASTTIGDVDLSGRLPDLPSASHVREVGAVVDGYLWSDPASGRQFLVAPPR